MVVFFASPVGVVRSGLESDSLKISWQFLRRIYSRPLSWRLRGPGFLRAAFISPSFYLLEIAEAPRWWCTDFVIPKLPILAHLQFAPSVLKERNYISNLPNIPSKIVEFTRFTFTKIIRIHIRGEFKIFLTENFTDFFPDLVPKSENFRPKFYKLILVKH